MNSFAAGRSVSADDIRHLWTAVKICQSQNLAPTRSSLIQHLTQNNLWRPDDAEVKLQHCLECGVVNEKINPNLGQDVLVICPPEEAPNLSSGSASAADVIPTVRWLNNMLSNNVDAKGIGSFFESLQSNIDVKFGNLETIDEFAIATFIDPRYKENIFVKAGTMSNIVETLKLLISNANEQNDFIIQIPTPSKQPRVENKREVGSFNDFIASSSDDEDDSRNVSGDMDYIDKPRPDHDWYCFYCHGEGTVLKCQHCWRCYHPACLSAIGIMEKPKGFTCLPCLTLQKVNKMALEGQTPDMSLVHSKIEVLLNWIDSTAPSIFDTLPDDSCDIAEEQAQWLIYEHIDLNQIKQKNRTYVYDIHQFLIDFELLAHVVILLYGKESTQGDVVNTILKDIKKEVDAFESGLMAAVPGRSDYMDDGSYESGKKRRKIVDGAMDQNSDMMRNSLPKETAVRQPTFMTSVDMQNMLNVPPGQCGCDAKYKQLLLELQQHWLNEFKADREKSMVELSERLHRDFTLEQEKTQADTMNRFKQELEATRKELDQRYTSQLKQEIQKLNEKHKKQLSESRKKQWCWQCEAEAIYHCCWNTAYCSVECQQQHWPQHRKLCRRKKQQNQN